MCETQNNEMERPSPVATSDTSTGQWIAFFLLLACLLFSFGNF